MIICPPSQTRDQVSAYDFIVVVPASLSESEVRETMTLCCCSRLCISCVCRLLHSVCFENPSDLLHLWLQAVTVVNAISCLFC